MRKTSVKQKIRETSLLGLFQKDKKKSAAIDDSKDEESRMLSQRPANDQTKTRLQRIKEVII